ncbi:hypothetical protein [Bradyrhizobium sp.]|uniref:hypothetical protein n=1 Tax=Bradyrhizobium sp. TaxID=376 RepID=UPI0027332528|nr:hypothetical protein [Bradyrhizobium sp.]MDP3074746.1 hypothetical protein [Bradyrhizobium sp.]
MLDSKLTKIKTLIEQKEKIDTQLAELIGETEKPKRGRPAKKDEPAAATIEE